MYLTYLLKDLSEPIIYNPDKHGVPIDWAPERFDDKNGNHKYDLNEPFADVNLNQIWNESVKTEIKHGDEEFLDLNKNSKRN